MTKIENQAGMYNHWYYDKNVIYNSHMGHKTITRNPSHFKQSHIFVLDSIHKYLQLWTASVDI